MIDWLREPVEIQRWQQVIAGIAIMTMTLRGLASLAGAI